MTEGKMSGKMILISMLIITMTMMSDGRPGRRYRCGMRRLVSASDCPHGHLQTVCGVVCKKGPGAVCGGSQGQYGECGAGLRCSECNRCSGCSYTVFKCFSDHDKCASSDDSPL